MPFLAPRPAVVGRDGDAGVRGCNLLNLFADTLDGLAGAAAMHN